MTQIAKGSIVLLLSLLAAAAGAQQVHRCGDGRTYTDKPCEGAIGVDLRANVLDAGPRFFPRYDPAPALVVPDSTTRPSVSEPGSVWDRQSQREAAHQSRTAPSRP